MDTPPWEPPFAGTEAEHLTGSLDRLRATFRWKADGLDDAGLATRIGSSELTLGSLLKHLACVEDEMWGPKYDGSGYGPSWAGMASYEGEPSRYTFDTTGLSAAELYRMWDDAAARSRERTAAAVAAGLDQRVELGREHDIVVTVRRLLCDQLEEYGRHTGHADLLREAVDGRVGEDPPADWRPGSVDPAAGA